MYRTTSSSSTTELLDPLLEKSFLSVVCFSRCSGTVNHEKRKFSRLILDVASVFFLPPFSFQIRVGGLYLLYSLYQCQNASPSEQVRTDSTCTFSLK